MPSSGRPVPPSRSRPPRAPRYDGLSVSDPLKCPPLGKHVSTVSNISQAMLERPTSTSNLGTVGRRVDFVSLVHHGSPQPDDVPVPSLSERHVALEPRGRVCHRVDPGLLHPVQGGHVPSSPPFSITRIRWRPACRRCAVQEDLFQHAYEKHRSPPALRDGGR